MEWTIRRAKNGRPALVGPDGDWCESRFRPDVDAARRVEEAGIEDDHRVILFGCGAGELPRAILSRISEGSLLIAEPCGGAFDAVIDFDGEKEWLSDPRVSLIVYGPPRKDLSRERVRFCATPAEFLSAIVAREAADRYVIHPHVAIPDDLSALRRYFDDIEVRRQSTLRFGEEAEVNLEANREKFAAARPVSSLIGALAGADIVVAGGGPSLRETASRMGPSANWIAVGTALRPLLLMGITPKFVVVTDPQARVADQLPDGGGGFDLVIFPTSSASAVAKSVRLIAAYPEGDGGIAAKARREAVGELPAGGTVTTTAIGLAVLLGARRVLLAGVDLLEPDGVSHADGSVPFEEAVRAVSRFEALEDRYRSRSQSASEDAVDVQGRPVRTRRNLAIYARAIENLVARYHHVEFVQLSSRARALRGVAKGSF